MVGRDLDEAVAFQLAIGPAGEVYREAGPKAARLFDTLVAALKDELKQFVRPEGVMMNSSSWMVTVQNPGSPPRPRGDVPAPVAARNLFIVSTAAAAAAIGRIDAKKMNSLGED
ncbi:MULTISPECIES: hypothetical protein [unclassified Bradyrhizobium]|uniref:hypothetical protein n=1 Tax=unclassified Bradyrhizobium TaxID=2631580 RepID=UPI001FFBE0E6|nr:MULTISPECIES: hypothetical protein [unclassified Bradyrhizobium]